MPTTESQEPRIDVDRASINRLLKFAREQEQAADEQGLTFGCTFWDGYQAGLREVLRMEHE
jgi:hypothetical protein